MIRERTKRVLTRLQPVRVKLREVLKRTIKPDRQIETGDSMQNHQHGDPAPNNSTDRFQYGTYDPNNPQWKPEDRNLI